MKNALLIATLLSTPLSAAATGMYQCEPIDESAWLNEAQVRTALTDQGWEVNRMKKDGGCWEVYGTTPEGVRVETYVKPDTAEILLIAQRGKILFEKEASE